MTTSRRRPTLITTTMLHAFTHAYGSMMVPLYLLIVADLKLPGVKAASLIVSLYTFVYCIGSYAAGVLSDRFSRKRMLGLGLLINATAIALMGTTHQYEWILVFAVLAGVGGTLFHPAAGALVPAHYPEAPGMAVGLLGVGSGVGFFLGPQLAGFFAAPGYWSWHSFHIAPWQKPCVELGTAGVLMGLIFLLVAREARGKVSATVSREPLGRAMSGRVMAIGLMLGFRDFAGVGSLSLAGIYLLRAHHFKPASVGSVLGVMMLSSVIVNPTLVWLTVGRWRLPALRIALILGGLIAATIPLFPARYALLVLCAFQTCQLGSYALSDSALLERVSTTSRGRVYGLFFFIAGTMGAAGPWVMGFWTDAIGEKANAPGGYVLPFAALGVAMTLAAFATPILARLGAVITSVDPLAEIVPSTVEVAG